MAQQLVIGLLLGVAIGVLAWRAGALTGNGAATAALTGGLIFGLGGLPWAALLLIFFVTSSGLSRAFRQNKQLVVEKYAKGSNRDWAQVLANGGAGALLVVCHAIFPEETWPWLAFAGTMAAVNADTWATELGILNRTPPRLITTGKVVEQGTSGGVSLLGYLAVVAGSLVIAIAALALNATPRPAGLLAAVSLAGVLGSSFDSLLGATRQAIYWCPACQKETERHPQHTCGALTSHHRGWRWMTNDLVNFAASLVGALSAVLFWGFF